MSIFPDSYNQNNLKTTSVTTSSAPDLLREYAWDFEANEILIDENGKFTIVEGLEAVKVRVCLALQIQRNRYLIYYSGIGNRLKSLIGKNSAYINKNIPSLLDEALVDNIYITSISDITCTLEDDAVTIEFTVNSIYGSYTTTTTT